MTPVESASQSENPPENAGEVGMHSSWPDPRTESVAELSEGG